MGAKVSNQPEIIIPEKPEEIIEYEGYEEFPIIEVAKNNVMKAEKDKVRPNPSLNNHSGGSSIGKYESENYINKIKEKTENNEEENKIKEENNVNNNTNNDINILNNNEEIKEPEKEDEKLRENNNNINIKENIEEQKIEENNDNIQNGINNNNDNDINGNININLNNGISEIKEEDINYNENEEKDEKENINLDIENNNINMNEGNEINNENNYINKDNENIINNQKDKKELDNIQTKNEKKEIINEVNINKNELNNDSKKNNDPLAPKKIILPEIDTIVSGKVLKEGAGNELLFMSNLNKIVNISIKERIKYANKFCICSKDNFLIYENRENYIQVKKPLAIIPISSIKDVVLFKLSKKVLTYDHFYIEFELDENNRNNVYNKIDTFYENNLDNKTNENLKNTAIVMFKTEEKDLAKEWFVLIKYLMNLKLNK